MTETQKHVYHFRFNVATKSKHAKAMYYYGIMFENGMD